METKFQTSFIPKKPLVTSGASIPPVKHNTGASLFMTLSVMIFIISILSAGGSYAWKQYLTNDQKVLQQQLKKREQEFNIDLISKLKIQNTQIDTAKKLLENHLAISQIFAILSSLTTESIRFLSLSVSSPTGTGDGLKISLTGHGTNFNAVAFQSDVLGHLEQYGLRQIVKNPIVADPALDQKGLVSFGLTATIDPNSLSYAKLIKGSEQTQ